MKDQPRSTRRSFLKKAGMATMAAPLLSFNRSNGGAAHINQSNQDFEFAFLTDIHIRPDRGAPDGFQMAIDKVNNMDPDFVITGGDLVYDVMRGQFDKSDGLFKLYQEMSKGFHMPVYNCIGNHDLFGIYEESPEGPDHPDYKYGMWERYFGDTYYAFEHKGWHFITLNSLEVTPDKKYKGFYHKAQLDWLESYIKSVDPATPIIVTTHLPMVCVYTQIHGGNPRTVSNAYEVFQILQNHNLKLVLQGHIHWKEYGLANDVTQFLTGGSIAGNGWKGRRHNTREGFMSIRVKDDEFSWEYIDHGWEAERLKREQ